MKTYNNKQAQSPQLTIETERMQNKRVGQDTKPGMKQGTEESLGQGI